jgi:hypothetical protein
MIFASKYQPTTIGCYRGVVATINCVTVGRTYSIISCTTIGYSSTIGT